MQSLLLVLAILSTCFLNIVTSLETDQTIDDLLKELEAVGKRSDEPDECFVSKMHGRPCYYRPEGGNCKKPRNVVARCAFRNYRDLADIQERDTEECFVSELNGRPCYYRPKGGNCKKPRNVVARCAFRNYRELVDIQERDTEECFVSELNGRPCYYRPKGGNCKKPRNVVARCAFRNYRDLADIQERDTEECFVSELNGRPCYYRPNGGNCKKPRNVVARCAFRNYRDLSFSSSDPIEQDVVECTVFEMHGRPCYYRPEGVDCKRPKNVVAKCAFRGYRDVFSLLNKRKAECRTYKMHGRPCYYIGPGEVCTKPRNVVARCAARYARDTRPDCRVYEINGGRRCWYRGYGQVCQKPDGVAARCASQPENRVERVGAISLETRDGNRECQVYNFKGNLCYFRPVTSQCFSPPGVLRRCAQGYGYKTARSSENTESSAGGSVDTDVSEETVETYEATKKDAAAESAEESSSVEERRSVVQYECLTYKLMGRPCYWKPEGDDCIIPHSVVARCAEKPSTSDSFDYWPFSYDPLLLESK